MINSFAEARSLVFSGVISMEATDGSKMHAADGMESNMGLFGLRSESNLLVRDSSKERANGVFIAFRCPERSRRTGITLDSAKLSVCIHLCGR